MRQKSLLLLLAAAASAQTRITNWEEQHQRFVRQAAFDRTELQGVDAAHSRRGRVHGDVDVRQGRRRRFVAGAAGRRGLVREGGRRARGRDGGGVLSITITRLG